MKLTTNTYPIWRAEQLLSATAVLFEEAVALLSSVRRSMIHLSKEYVELTPKSGLILFVQRDRETREPRGLRFAVFHLHKKSHSRSLPRNKSGLPFHREDLRGALTPHDVFRFTGSSRKQDVYLAIDRRRRRLNSAHKILSKALANSRMALRPRSAAATTLAADAPPMPASVMERLIPAQAMELLGLAWPHVAAVARLEGMLYDLAYYTTHRKAALPYVLNFSKPGLLEAAETYWSTPECPSSSVSITYRVLRALRLTKPVKTAIQSQQKERRKLTVRLKRTFASIMRLHATIPAAIEAAAKELAQSKPSSCAGGSSPSRRLSFVAIPEDPLAPSC